MQYQGAHDAANPKVQANYLLRKKQVHVSCAAIPLEAHCLPTQRQLAGLMEEQSVAPDLLQHDTGVVMTTWLLADKHN